MNKSEPGIVNIQANFNSLLKHIIIISLTLIINNVISQHQLNNITI